MSHYTIPREDKYCKSRRQGETEMLLNRNKVGQESMSSWAPELVGYHPISNARSWNNS